MYDWLIHVYYIVDPRRHTSSAMQLCISDAWDIVLKNISRKPRRLSFQQSEILWIEIDSRNIVLWTMLSQDTLFKNPTLSATRKKTVTFFLTLGGFYYQLFSFKHISDLDELNHKKILHAFFFLYRRSSFYQKFIVMSILCSGSLWCNVI